MTIQTVQPHHHLSIKSVTLGLAGVALAVSAGYGAAALLIDEGTVTAPDTVVSDPYVRDSWSGQLGSGSQPRTDVRDSWAPPAVPPSTTDRELRELMHRR